MTSTVTRSCIHGLRLPEVLRKRGVRAPVDDWRGGRCDHRAQDVSDAPNGRPYVNDYCFAYEVLDGRVTAIRDYMDTRGGWLQVFGGDPPEVLLQGTQPDS
jgi:ketosteroid isomerase-like protein